MRVWKLADDVDAEMLAPRSTMAFGIEVSARHCLQALRPEFAREVRRGDVIAATGTFGIGSSLEQAASVLVHLGVAAVIAPAYSGLYFRNAFNVGLLLLTCPRVNEIADGSSLRLDPRAGQVVTAEGQVLPCQAIPAFLLEMVEAGGLLAQLKQRQGR